MNSRRPGTLTRAASGGVVIIAAVLALLFIQGPGAGTGDGGSPAESTSTDRSELAASAESEDTVVKSDQRAKSGGLTESERAAVEENTLVILIDEHDYLMHVPGDKAAPWHSIDLPRLTQVAQHADGDSNGIRVRIQKRSTSRASAEKRILVELKSIGIGPDAVFESPELVD
ncbi:MAG: hypothetical protein MK102_05565 [Fuerstiella sp.]|nr:hypothetical protein [Fuerstiella sp.]